MKLILLELYLNKLKIIVFRNKLHDLRTEQDLSESPQIDNISTFLTLNCLQLIYIFK